ncbi:hypothetical protein CDHC04_1960 [Corynebacterium diphtheriae HC04]|nr:hypothetical protein CDHC04_1960 [Corynebacterium diphtheriae HC04]
MKLLLDQSLTHKTPDTLQEKADQDKKIKKHALMPPKPHTKRVRQASRAS